MKNKKRREPQKIVAQIVVTDSIAGTKDKNGQEIAKLRRSELLDAIRSDAMGLRFRVAAFQRMPKGWKERPPA